MMNILFYSILIIFLKDIKLKIISPYDWADIILRLIIYLKYLTICTKGK